MPLLAGAHRAPAGAHIKAGNGDTFKTDLAPGETFEVPPARKLYWKVEAISRGGTRLNSDGPVTFATPDRAT